MRLAISVTQNGSPFTVETRPSDLVAWERATGKSVSEWGTTPPTYSDVAYLAWRAATRGQAHRTAEDFDAWLDDGVTDLTLTEVDDARPTQEDRPTG